MKTQANSFEEFDRNSIADFIYFDEFAENCLRKVDAKLMKNPRRSVVFVFLIITNFSLFFLIQQKHYGENSLLINLRNQINEQTLARLKSEWVQAALKNNLQSWMSEGCPNKLKILQNF